MDESIEFINKFLSVSKSISHLNLSSCGLTFMGLRKLCDNLGTTTLTSLSLAGNFLFEDLWNDLSRVETLVNDLGKLPLKALNISSTKLSITLRIVSSLIGNSSGLTSLDLSSNSLGDIGADQLSLALHSSQSLTSLNLSCTNIGEIGCRAIAIGLQSNSSLRSVILKGNQVGSAFQELASALHSNTTLTHLDLSNCGLSAVAAQTMFQKLFLNRETALKSLVLAFNQIEGELEIPTVVVQGKSFLFALFFLSSANSLFNKSKRTRLP
jgi:Ran GTPase-activating protein (RanGAP) involved in mRNA processing and transport